MNTTTAPATWEWESFEGGAIGTHTDTDTQIEIDALQDAGQAAKWGERHTPGRAWTAYLADGRNVSGRSSDLRTAKRDAVAAATA